MGNQIQRPGVRGSIAYTPFDLPASYTLAAVGVVTLDYDGGQRRIRKTVETTSPKETVYFDDLYERVTQEVEGFNGGSTVVQHKWAIRRTVEHTSAIRRGITMTINVEIEFFASARDAGLTYVESPEVGLVSIVGKRCDLSSSLTEVTVACVERLEALVDEWSTILPGHRFMMLAATSSQLVPNVLARHRGIWGSEEMRWLSAGARRSPTVEAQDVTGTRFAGLAEVPEGQLPAAADHARTTGNGVILFSEASPLSMEQALSLYARAFPSSQSTVNWASMSSLLLGTDDILLKVHGGFDDREAAVYAMMSSELMARLRSTKTTPS